MPTEQLHEIFILSTGHKRCTGCGEIMLNMTDDHTLVCPDGFLSEISSELLPEDFDPDTLPDGLCGGCEHEAIMFCVSCDAPLNADEADGVTCDACLTAQVEYRHVFDEMTKDAEASFFQVSSKDFK